MLKLIPLNSILFIVLLFLVPSNAFAQELPEAFVGPGGCTIKEECRSYCNIDSNKEECLTFAVEKGMMTQEEADKARKFLNQTGPGGCRGDECKNYCEDPTHTEECLKFAVENGMIDEAQAARMRKMKEIAEMSGPGGCKGQECRAYCEDEAHMEECFAFARENGLVGEKEVEGYETGKKIRAKIETAGGPGGCRSERECHEYCSDASRVEECVAFGAESTGKSPEEIRRMLEEFKNNNDGERFEPNKFREPEGFRQDRENFEERRQEYERRMMEARERREGMMREGYGAPERIMPPEAFEQYRDMRPPEGQMPPESYQTLPPEQYRTYEQPPQEFQRTYESAPAPEPQPTSYDHSRSFLANVWSAFLAPFKNR
ncbi:MAG: hypothetical protein A2758_01365 [Candidatus Zambryskibacteria bacterium RIFCSPHIGHO2_01_FULL_49_18]|uniref:Uncharacterized protein n=2 Tax=Candidatus Zambryskiibacteriota TaxID=1817925 RepID=A0A1G2T173_9BACT|nr:MAG: hypothetical protein A2758_01365 [Candidatus Zambryskibacteria bacterium RIFCSPHIGHO2_01_FULL_49_18]OHB05309.1 MAG: hypothetical protein A3A26_01830 [Candidatus Zambryskibacteria bacterium RIFCSPLOWO2_01_FULL_47_14]